MDEPTPIKAWLYIRSEDRPGRAILLARKTTRIGRDPSVEVSFPSTDANTVVSRVHAEIERDDNGYWIRESGNCLNGTFLDGRRVRERVKLKSGSKIQLGQTGPVLIFTEADEPPAFTVLETACEPGRDTEAVSDRESGESAAPFIPSIRLSTVSTSPEGGVNPSRSQVLIGSDLYLGRHPQSSFAFDPDKDRVVSTTHARISHIKGRFFLFDLESCNGTWLKDRNADSFHRISGFVPLRHQDEFALGNPERGGPVLLFELATTPPPVSALEKDYPTVGNPFATPASSADEMEPLASADLSGPIVHLGRCPQSPLTIDDPSVSWRHIRLEAREGWWHFTDAGSLNGIYRNGQRVKTGVVMEGDVFTIGQTTLRYSSGKVALLKPAATPALYVYELRASSRASPHREITRELDRLSFTIKAGEFVGLLGPRGAGKTLLLQVLLGAAPLDDGAVKVIGIDVHADSRRATHAIGFISDEAVLQENLSVEEALLYRTHLRLPPETPDADREVRIDEILRLVELSDRRKSLVQALSLCQKRRLTLALELVTRPSVLLMDHPIVGLDETAEMSLLSTYRNLSRNGTAILLATDQTHSTALFDRVLVLVGGKLAFLGRAESAHEFFGIDNLDDLPSRIHTKPPSAWKSQFDRLRVVVGAPRPSPPPPNRELRPPIEPVMSSWSSFDKHHWIVTAGRYAVSVSRGSDGLFYNLLGLPSLLAAGVCVATRTESQAFFLMPIVTFWLAASHASNEYGRDRLGFVHERRAGYGTLSFVCSKLPVLMLVSLIQTILVYGVVSWYGRHEESFLRGVAALWLTGMAGIGAGAAVAGLTTSTQLAARLVPLVAACQILFCGSLGQPQAGSTGIEKITAVYWGHAMLCQAHQSVAQGESSGRSVSLPPVQVGAWAVVALFVQMLVFLYVASIGFSRWGPSSTTSAEGP